MNYIKTQITMLPFSTDSADLFSALLSEMGYDSFEENSNSLLAYVPEKDYDEQQLKQLLDNFNDAFENLTFHSEVIKGENWNKKWEENFSPMQIDDFCIIKAPFHNIESDCKHTIIIEPKMAFGTGHHSTTASVIRLMNELDFANLNVLDMGCGTGILSIFASQRNAKQILAIDIDEWAYNNSKENAKLNNITNIAIQQGDVHLLNNKKFDVILANINRNVLLEHIPTYSTCLNKGGKLILSGFYTEDLDMIKQCATDNGLTYQKYISDKNWVAALFTL